MLDPKWEDFRPAFTEILEDLERNRAKWVNVAAQKDLPIDAHVAACLSEAMPELADSKLVSLSYGEIAFAMESLLWDFLRYRWAYAEQAATKGMPLNEYMFEALVHKIAGYVDFVREWDAESAMQARHVARAKQSWLFPFFAPLSRFWHTPVLTSQPVRKKRTDDSDQPF